MMKKTTMIILCLVFHQAFAEVITEKKIKTDVSEVTVFIEGAQVTRKKTVDLQKGKTVLKFDNLSPFIDAKSVQVKTEGQVTVLSVNHQQNFIKKQKQSSELSGLYAKLHAVEDQIKLEQTHLLILKEELDFLNVNRDLGGKDQALSVTNLKEASAFYSSRLTSLKLKEIERNKTVKKLNRQKDDYRNQIRTLTSKKEFPTGEVLVKVDAKVSARAEFEISYVVDNAGWFPSYDIRAKNINEPVELIYKANVRQDTKVDWKNVKLKFSSSDPKVSGVAPELKTYFLNYNTLPPVYKKSLNQISGKVFDQNKEPLPGASVMVEGTTIGTIADMVGNYSITIPNNAAQLTYSFIGFQSKTLPISNSVMNVVLEEDDISLEEVAVIGYGGSKLKNLNGAVAGVMPKKSKKIKIRGVSSQPIPVAQVEKQTTVDFEIAMPYSVLSDNKNYAVDMAAYDLPAFYQYYCVPKVDKDAFLIANITDWEMYNLLEGEANVFFEDTYVGKSLLDVRSATDTLQISLGRDKNVSINREKSKDYRKKQFIGSKKEESRGWMTTVKNNKSQKINMMLLDQVPVSTLDEIEIVVNKISGAKHDTESGELKWEFSLAPGDKKEFELKYSVKYPKNRNLVIE